MEKNDFTTGRILPKLLGFMMPVLLALFLQALYGAVDLLMVGRFAATADVSAVSTGSQLMMTVTYLIASFSIGITVTIAQKLGQRDQEATGGTIGTGIILFAVIGLVFSFLCLLGAAPLARIMNVPAEAFSLTVQYIRICGGGFLIITAYNLLGGIFRGLGDSKTPLMAVAIACGFNILGDYIFVAVFHRGAAGAAVATVMAQLLSVVISLVIIRRSPVPVALRWDHFRFDRQLEKRIVKIGAPVALQDGLVSISFLVLLSIINGLGLTASAALGVAEKVCAFIMLVPSAFMQSMSSFVGQNIGADLPQRARLALKNGICVSAAFGVAMFAATFFFGDCMAAVFSTDPAVIADAFSYLRSYAIDCLLTCFLFCFIGYYNGLGRTAFVMLQGICGAFCVRIPVAFLMQRFAGGSMFLIGLSTPCATIVQITLCFIAYRRITQEVR